MKQFTLWVIGVFAFTLISSAAEAQQVYGELKVVKGNVNIKSGRDAKVTKAAMGLRVFPSDTIITGKDSRAKILMVDKNEINISPDSEIVLQKYVYDAKTDKKEVLLNVLSGKVRAKVEQKYNGTTAKFQVKTPSAVAGVRGTDFLTSYDSSTKQSSVVTFHGKVEFGQAGSSGAIEQPVMVSPGQTSTAAAGAAPSAPVEMPKQQLASMDKESNAETATVNTSPSSDSSRQPSADEKKKEEGTKEEGAKKEGASTDGAKKEDSKSEGTKSETAKNEGNKSDGTKSDGAKTEGAKTEGAKTEGSKTAGTGSGSGVKTDGMKTDKSPVGENDRNPASVQSGTTGPKTDRVVFDPKQDLVGGGGGCTNCKPPDVVILPGAGGGGACGGAACPPPPPPITDVKCDFCNQTIQNGNTKLLININTQ